MDTSDNSFSSEQTRQGQGVLTESGERCMRGNKIASENALAVFLEELTKIPSSEEQITFSLDRMEEALNDATDANLRLFWAIRKHCLPLFHQEKDAGKKAESWNRYLELTKEGRRIKALADGDGAFVTDQIELAISCLEKDVNTALQNVNSDDVDAVFLETQALEKHREFYKTQHATLVWLSSFSTKIVALRKELMNVGMRMKLKSEFFQRLSVLGNQVFPLRKELIEKVSGVFHEDVNAFISRYFAKADKAALKRSVFFLRKEIKNLQNVAKKLFVSSNIFSETRLKLGQCWDQLKGLEKEIRQEQGRLRAASVENSKEVRGLLEAAEKIVEEEEDLIKVRKHLEGIAKRIRALDLVHDDVVALKAELQVLFDRLHVKQEAAEQIYQERLLKESQAKQEAIQTMSSRIVEFSQACEAGNITSSSKEEWQELKEALAKMNYIPLPEKISLDNQLNQALTMITNFFEERLLSSSDSREKLENMRQVLSQRLERRKELKEKLEKDKKLLGSSGLDFDRAMQYSSLVEEDKQALEELDQSILMLKKQIQQML
ncbi:hypothetical protein [Chlamydia pecorum]|uniref:hypothetical protein n=1 Tax=Chlamydia pecorum TaxID=85991 RepID=UPI0005A7C891|nr:hypothetical protein [Chlamydia pecorum]